jgi:hypothetical protein
MHNIFINFLSSVINDTLLLLSNAEPGYADVFRIIIGSSAWIGGLAYFMWRRDKKKEMKVLSA